MKAPVRPPTPWPRSTPALPPGVIKTLEIAVDLARTHMIEARRSVGALRPHAAEGEDVAAALHRMTDLTRRTTEVPIDLTIEELSDDAAAPFVNEQLRCDQKRQYHQ